MGIDSTHLHLQKLFHEMRGGGREELNSHTVSISGTPAGQLSCETFTIAVFLRLRFELDLKDDVVVCGMKKKT